MPARAVSSTKPGAPKATIGVGLERRPPAASALTVATDSSTTAATAMTRDRPRSAATACIVNALPQIASVAHFAKTRSDRSSRRSDAGAGCSYVREEGDSVTSAQDFRATLHRGRKVLPDA